MKCRTTSLVAAATGLLSLSALAQEPAQKPTLYVAGYAHLDTQWRWTYPQTIREFLAHTLHDNFALFEKHPEYVFNFTGSRRYQMFKEYFPKEYEQLKQYVAAGRWFPAGSSVDENDANTPSAESLIRNVMYGNHFFREEFGKASSEYMLPDCFGFPAALPSVLAHCGLTGFSTQKLTWGSVVGIPFNVGVWIGPDGHSVIAALNPGQYDGQIEENLATSEKWKKRIEADGQKSGLYADFRYYGTGDVGGAPKEASVKLLEQSLATDGPVKVVAGPANELFDSITPAQRAKLPEYTGELELTEHSAGSATSQAYMKRWNRKNEFLANEAESAAVMANWISSLEYPAQRLEDAWTLVLGSQMHDIISGTALTTGYEYAWNDEVLAANQFQAVLRDSMDAIAAQLDTRGEGQALVLFNPLAGEREDVVEAEIPGAATSRSVRVLGADMTQVPAQILSAAEGKLKIAFLARMPSLGWTVFHAVPSSDAPASSGALHVDAQGLENERYVVKLDANGDVASIHDKRAKHELLSAPARLELCYENPKNWPAWNQDWTDRQLAPREIVTGPARVRVVESGPARVALEVRREANGSIFTQQIRLGAGGAGDRVEFDTRIDWSSRERSLRAAFPLAVANEKATYDCQTGVVERGNMHKQQYEYGFQQWFDVTDTSGAYGVSVMSDCKYAGDKPDDKTLRLTLLHTPGTHGGYEDQATQDVGRHHMLYAVSGHEQGWSEAGTPREAERLNQPILSFRASAHEGALGKSFTLLRTSNDNVAIQAVKQAEDGQGIIVRLREHSGRAQTNVQLAAGAAIVSAIEVDGQEREIGKARLEGGSLACDLGAHELRAFRIALATPPVRHEPRASVPVPLTFDRDVISTNANRADGFLPAEQLPARIVAGDATFELGPTTDGARNAVSCRGQELALPLGVERVYLLAASDGSSGSVKAEFAVDGKSVVRDVQAWSGMIGQWDTRLWAGETPELAYGWSNRLAGIVPGFVQPAEVAWFASHHHTPQGDAFYEYSYLYKIAIDLPAGAKLLRLPKNEHVLVLAASAVYPAARVEPAAPLFDTLEEHVQDAPQVEPAAGSFKDVVEVALEPRLYFRTGRIHYTLDGTQPSANSAVYSGPFVLDHKATIQAAVLDDRGELGPVVSASLAVNDVTPPSVVRVRPAYESPIVRIEFSEPVSDTGLLAANYSLEPAIAVRSTRRGTSTREVVLELASAPQIGKRYTLQVSGVSDASPAHNTLAPATFTLQVQGPVFERKEIAKEQMGVELKDVPNLPVKAGDSWTLNFFVRADKQPEERTVIAGFGRCEQLEDGAARYIVRFQQGIQFWAHNRDVPGRVQLELGRWQMISATYDGTRLRLYRDGKLLGERDISLVDDSSVVNFAPPDPWDQRHRFEGELHGFTIWGEALGEDALRSLLEKDAPR
ncbi:MAG: chitobiase/beta-hexosaminidase C-terminal domain-containing protein [Planctomycetes bacterium]|nr:chitobiase/beta-hexosaminidase C-terminal domain-containing protein [Planctomycetota bacterium]